MGGCLVAAEHGRRTPGGICALASRHDLHDARCEIGASSDRTYIYAAAQRHRHG